MASSTIIRRLRIGRSEQLDLLARECGRIYTQALTMHWRFMSTKGKAIRPLCLRSLNCSSLLSEHTTDACVKAFREAALSIVLSRRGKRNNRIPDDGIELEFRQRGGERAVCLKVIRQERDGK